jgi:hypothetical protein
MESLKDAEIVERLDGMAAEVRRLRRLAAALVAAMLALIGYAAYSRPRPGRAVVAGSVEIRDKDGRLRGTFGVDRDGLPGLRLYDQRGLEQVALAIPTDDFSALYFQARGSLRVALESSIEGTASFRLVDKDARPRATMSLAQDGTPRIAVDDVAAQVVTASGAAGPAIDLAGPPSDGSIADLAPLAPSPPAHLVKKSPSALLPTSVRLIP